MRRRWDALRRGQGSKARPSVPRLRLTVVAEGRVGPLDDVQRHAIEVGGRLEPVPPTAPQAARDVEVAGLVEAGARERGVARATVDRRGAADEPALLRVARAQRRALRGLGLGLLG